MLMVLLGQLIRGMRGLLHFRWSIFKGVEIVESRLANLSRIGGPIILPSFGCRVAGLHAMSRDDEMASVVPSADTKLCRGTRKPRSSPSLNLQLVMLPVRTSGQQHAGLHSLTCQHSDGEDIHVLIKFLACCF